MIRVTILNAMEENLPKGSVAIFLLILGSIRVLFLSVQERSREQEKDTD